MTSSKKLGKILTFDRESCYGHFEMEGKRYEYHSSYFHAGLPARWPVPGEDVEVAFDDERLVELRAMRDAKPPVARSIEERLARLKAAGWKGRALQEFLGLSDEEMAEVEQAGAP